MNTLALNLKYYREQNHLKQKDLADKLNITQRAYSFYETGRSEPKIDILLKIAEIYKIPLDVLVGRNYKSSVEVKNEISNNRNGTINISQNF